jgi:hypothetical protein
MILSKHLMYLIVSGDCRPPTYLIQLDRGMPLDTDCYHMLPALQHSVPPPPVTISGPGDHSSGEAVQETDN